METRRIGKINWIIIGLYGLLSIYLTIETATMQTDAAGRGMAWGFLMIGLIYVTILAGLNLIRVHWVRFIVLVLALIPPAYILLQIVF